MYRKVELLRDEQSGKIKGCFLAVGLLYLFSDKLSSESSRSVKRRDMMGDFEEDINVKKNTKE